MSAQNAHAHEDRLLDFAYGELPASEAQSLEQHVQGCARCSKALADIRGVRSTMAHLSVEPAPDAGLESLLAYAQQSARRAAAGPEPKPSRWRRWLLPAVGLATVSTFGVLTLAVNEGLKLEPALSQKAAEPRIAAKEQVAAKDAPARQAPSSVQPSPAPAAAPMAEGALSESAMDELTAQAPRGSKGGDDGRPSDWMNSGSGGALLERRRAGPAEAKKKLSSFRKTDAMGLEPPKEAEADSAAASAGAPGLRGKAESFADTGSDKARKDERESLRLGGASYGRGLASDDGDLAEEAAQPPPPPPAAVTAAAPMAPSEQEAPSPQVAQSATGSVRREQAPGKAMAAPPTVPESPVRDIASAKPMPVAKSARSTAMTARDLARQAQIAASQGDRARESQLLRAALAAGASGSERLSLLSRLCESEYAQGRRTEGAEACARIVDEAPGSSEAGLAQRWLRQGVSDQVLDTAPAQAAPAAKKE